MWSIAGWKFSKYDEKLYDCDNGQQDKRKNYFHNIKDSSRPFNVTNTV